ncbi:hypothetical protein PVT67_00245 [Gallaecimonas kandeliae]|uniref:hypothetical protein n=1 Tax=Gallaecimonas kandeliae TaxID=3029055 RepID=UPI0026483763|nr:hypothetical protein [Gallaecimonas kandeliae]WKE65721.1 hypothetical protein PVT67_00245 [Gallaecimonas kandeliae]
MQAEKRFEDKLTARLRAQALAPDDELWRRIEVARPRRHLWPWLGSAAVLGLLLVQEWPAGAPVAPLFTPYELLAQDRQLQQAYLDDANDQQLAALWRQRNALMDEMAQGHGESK